MRDGRDTRGDAGGAVRATDYSIQGPIQPSHSAPARYADRPDLVSCPDEVHFERLKRCS